MKQRKSKLLFISPVAIALLLICFLAPRAGAGEPNQGNTAPVSRVVARMRSIGSFQANISINTAGGFIRGRIEYQKGKIHFHLSDGRVIASDGKVLTVYTPVSNVAGKQSIYSGGGGLGWLLSGFRVRVMNRTAHLKALDTERKIQEVKLEWDADYILKQITIIRKESNTRTSIIISDVTPIKNISAGRFSWHPPAGGRTVENPLNRKN